MNPGSRRQTTTLVLILCVGAVLRGWGIERGLPYAFVHDEIYEVFRALELVRGEYDFFRVAKGFYFYILALEYALAGIVQTLLGRVDSIGEFVSRSVAVPGLPLLLSRATNVVIGTASILLLYRLGRRVLRREADALLLALAWATCNLAVWMATWGWVETTLATLGIAAFFPLLRMLDGGGRRDYLLAAVLIACASATKVYGIALLAPFGLAHLLRHRPPGGRLRSALLDGRLWSGALVFGLVLLLVDPSIVSYLLLKMGLVDPERFVGEHREVIGSRHLAFYLQVLRWNVGNVGTPFVLLGLAAGFVRRRRDLMLVAAFVAAFVLPLGLIETRWAYERYMLLALPFLLLLAVYGVQVATAFLTVRLPVQGRQLRAVVIVAMAITFTWNGLESLYHNGLLRRPFEVVDVEAKEWIESEIPEGAAVLIRSEGIWPGHLTVPLYDLADNYAGRYRALLARQEPVKNMRALPDLARAEGLVRYDLVTVDRSETWRTLEEYLEEGTEVFVVDVEKFSEGYRDIRSRESLQSRIQLRDSLQASDRVALLRRFSGRRIQGAEKTIEVWGTLEESTGTQ